MEQNRIAFIVIVTRGYNKIEGAPTEPLRTTTGEKENKICIEEYIQKNKPRNVNCKKKKHFKRIPGGNAS